MGARRLVTTGGIATQYVGTMKFDSDPNYPLFAFPARAIPALRSLSASELATVEVDPSGGALRWDELDVDLSVPGLLLSAVGVDERRRHFAGLAGSVRSDAKGRTARANGKKGGRPRRDA